MIGDSLFGIFVNRKKKEKERDELVSFTSPNKDDGSLEVPVNSAFGSLNQMHTLAMDAGVSSDVELIERYRTIAAHSEINRAISEICDEAIVFDDVQPVISLDISNVDDKLIGKDTKEKIHQEFDNVLSLLKFNSNAYELFRRWYIDSKLVYHKVINPDRPKEGIKELRFVDPRKIKKIKEIKKVNENGFDVTKVVSEYFLYVDRLENYNKTFGGHLLGDGYVSADTTTSSNKALKISPDAIAYIHSGQIDQSTGMIYGYLQQSVKLVNQLRMLEDALVIYRLARAPERRIFYIDVGNMGESKSAHYVKQIQNRYRNKVSYDAKTGNISDERRTISMQEDFWLPRREGSRGTQIETLPGGQNLGELSDIEYFEKKLWQSLHVPASRYNSDASSLLSQSSEITRDESKFSNFIKRIRNQFSKLITDILKTQLILKGIITEQEWAQVSEFLKYVYASNSYYAEAREAEILSNRLSSLDDIRDHIGVYYSRAWVMKNVLKLTDDDIKEMNKEIEQEKKEGLVPDEQDERD